MKKFICSIIAATVLLSSNLSVYAVSSSPGEGFNPENYIHYTIDFVNNERSNSVANSSDNTVEQTKLFVQSLNLGDKGFQYVEDACLQELQEYEENNVEIEKYIVLVPKDSSLTYYGTVGSNDFYCEYTSASNVRIDTYGKEKDSNNEDLWNEIIIGVAELPLNFLETKFALGFYVFDSIAGLYDPPVYQYESKFVYCEQYDLITTFSVYREQSPGNYKLGYQSQDGDLRIIPYFCPVTSAFDGDYIQGHTIFDGHLDTDEGYSKDQILTITNIQCNHNNVYTQLLVSYHVKELWNEV